MNKAVVTALKLDFLFLLLSIAVCHPEQTQRETGKSIPWSQIGAKAGADYKGDGLSVTPIKDGARLRCAFQRLEGEATPEGLWLTSRASETATERFRVVANAVGRSTAAQISSAGLNAQSDNAPIQLSRTGKISVEGKTVRFSRPGLVEEYSVSMDGVRQDFIVEKPPVEIDSSFEASPAENERSRVHELTLALEVTGARVERIPDGARLVLENSERKIAYSRLHVSDATGKELPARVQVDQTIATKSQTANLEIFINDIGADYPIRIDPTFSDDNWISMGGIPGTDGRVYAFEVDNHGNLYIGGDFRVAGDVAANNIAKWDGNSWSALGSGLNKEVHALAVLGNDLYAGGYFDIAGGIAASRIAKWNGRDWLPLGSGIKGELSALAVLDKAIYAAGSFTMAGEIEANNIAKWDGSSWSPLGLGMGGAEVISVNALAVLGNDLYAGGEFTTAGGSAAGNIAKWNGSNWSALGSGVYSTPSFIFPSIPAVNALLVVKDQLYAAGGLDMAGGIAASKIARWDGSNWSALGSGMNYYSGVNALAAIGNDLYAGGWFNAAGEFSAIGIAKWDGSNWSPVASGMNDNVNALTVLGDNLFAGGNFYIAGGVAASHCAKWNGNYWSSLGSDLKGFSGPVNTLAVSGKNVIVGGLFPIAGGLLVNSISEWNGNEWSTLGSGLVGSPAIVRSLFLSGNDLYTGGSFDTAGNVRANNLAKWDGSNWSALVEGIDASIDKLAVLGTELYPPGRFSGLPSDVLTVRNGLSWRALGYGVSSPLTAVAVLNNELYVAGLFKTGAGKTDYYVVKWKDGWVALGSAMNDSVSDLAVLANELYAGGKFTMTSGIVANHLAKWNGSNWVAVGSGLNADVSALTVIGNDLYVGGSFTLAGDIMANHIAKWDGRIWSSLGSGISGSNPETTVDALAELGNELWVGGNFTTAGGKVSPNLARFKLSFAPDLLKLQKIKIGSQTNTLSYSGVPNFPYFIQYATNLTSSPWFTLSTNLPGSTGVGTVIDPNSNADPQRFYRVGYRE